MLAISCMQTGAALMHMRSSRGVRLVASSYRLVASRQAVAPAAPPLRSIRPLTTAHRSQYWFILCGRSTRASIDWIG